ncbi:MAG: hypothetical protein ACRCZF_22515 [Gemmataceae bacterium]
MFGSIAGGVFAVSLLMAPAGHNFQVYASGYHVTTLAAENARQSVKVNGSVSGAVPKAPFQSMIVISILEVDRDGKTVEIELDRLTTVGTVGKNGSTTLPLEVPVVNATPGQKYIAKVSVTISGKTRSANPLEIVVPNPDR